MREIKLIWNQISLNIWFQFFFCSKKPPQGSLEKAVDLLNEKEMGNRGNNFKTISFRKNETNSFYNYLYKFRICLLVGNAICLWFVEVFARHKALPPLEVHIELNGVWFVCDAVWFVVWFVSVKYSVKAYEEKDWINALKWHFYTIYGVKLAYFSIIMMNYTRRFWRRYKGVNNKS